MAKLEAGSTAPAFTLPDQDGNPVKLSDFKGQQVIVYFYPAAMTPGCTKEACDFTAALIRKKIIEDIGFPDLRYFHAADDLAYGYLASQRASSVCLNYKGILRYVPDAPPMNRTTPCGRANAGPSLFLPYASKCGAAYDHCRAGQQSDYTP